MAAVPRNSPYASVHEPQLTIDGREVLEPVPAPAPRCEVLELFNAPQTMRGQLAAELEPLQDACPVPPACASGPENARERTFRGTSSTSSDAAAEERAAREQLRRLEKMHRGAAKARDRQWRERLREILRETRARYPRCKCELRPGMSRAELQHLAGGCTDPNYVCPRLAAVRRLIARREGERAS